MSKDFFPQRPDSKPTIYAYKDTHPQYKEQAQRSLLTKKWGRRIVKFKGNDTNPIVNVPIGGI